MATRLVQQLNLLDVVAVQRQLLRRREALSARAGNVDCAVRLVPCLERGHDAAIVLRTATDEVQCDGRHGAARLPAASGAASELTVAAVVQMARLSAPCARQEPPGRCRLTSWW